MLVHAKLELIHCPNPLSKGKCKTRLASDIGVDMAASFSAASTLDLLERLGGQDTWASKLLFAPRDMEPAFKALVESVGSSGDARGPGWQLVPIRSTSAGEVRAMAGTRGDKILADYKPKMISGEY